jgi:hypothetical protein
MTKLLVEKAERVSAVSQKIPRQRSIRCFYCSGLMAVQLTLFDDGVGDHVCTKCGAIRYADGSKFRKAGR